MHIIFFSMSILLYLLLHFCLQNKMKQTTFIKCQLLYWLMVFFGSVYFLQISDILSNDFTVKYINTTKEVLGIILLLVGIGVLLYFFIGLLSKKYSLRIENFTIGGINVFFDQSSEIFIKTVGTFISSKRSIFNFNPERDNISEVLDSYYSVYNYIRENLDLLEQEKDEEVYIISIDALKKLNFFLTKHQSDYRRWYGVVTTKDKITTKDGEELIVHNTTIEKVQEQYHRYMEILADFKDINNFFEDSSFKEVLRINSAHWGKEFNA